MPLLGARGMTKTHEPLPEPPERKSSASQLWNLLIRGVLAAVVVGIVVPRVVAELRDTQRAQSAEKRGKEPQPATAAEGSGWRPLAGGGGGSYSAADVMACNRAAQAARRYSSQKLPSDLATAMSAGKGSLVGATADSLSKVGLRARDDARAAAVYEACLFERAS